MYVYTIAVLSLGLVFSVTGNPVGIDQGKEYEQDIEKYKDAIAVSSECADRDGDATAGSKPRPSPVMALFEDGKPLTLACSKYENHVQAGLCLVLLNQLNATCNSEKYNTTMKDLFTVLKFKGSFGKDTESKICDSAFKDPVFQSIDPHSSCEICDVGLPVRVACIMLWQMNIASGTTSPSSAETNVTSAANTGTVSGSPKNQNPETVAGSSATTTKDKTDDANIEQKGDTTGEGYVIETHDDTKTITGEDKEEPDSKSTPPEENADANKFTSPEEKTDEKDYSDDATKRQGIPSPPESSPVVHDQDKTDNGDQEKIPDDIRTGTGDGGEAGSKITPPEVPDKSTDGKNDDNDGTTKRIGDQDFTNTAGKSTEKESKSESFDTSSLITSPLCQSGPMLDFYKDGNIQEVSPFNTACQSTTTDPASIEVCKSAMDSLQEFCLHNDKYSSVATAVGNWITFDPTQPVKDEEGLCQTAFQSIPGNKPDCKVCSTQSVMRPVCYMLYHLNYYMPRATASGNPDKNGDEVKSENNALPNNEGDNNEGGATDEGARGGAINPEVTHNDKNGDKVEGEGNTMPKNEGDNNGEGATDEEAEGGTRHVENETNEYVGDEQVGGQYEEGKFDKGTGGSTTSDEKDKVDVKPPEDDGSFIPFNDYGNDQDGESSIMDEGKTFQKEASDNDHKEEEIEIEITGDEQQNPMKEETLNKNTYNVYKNRNFAEEESSSHFLAFSLTAIILILATYIAYHNKHKIIAVIIEGRSGRNGGRRGGSYRRLNQNVSS
ncbi:dentin sialophosphoprotein-like isoform X2 [Anneissia japonica]|uniref:dentin sialophosphoprotein-like isoform X2 n=1 Tax=Anneissia japonica TaxID=1529436 RepID=UPI001425A1CD|nr:dentin sialophosphoprotein-like isoform X2 [Anneissia japonica]